MTRIIEKEGTKQTIIDNYNELIFFPKGLKMTKNFNTYIVVDSLYYIKQRKLVVFVERNFK